MSAALCRKTDARIEQMGIGRFHIIAILICGLGNASDAVELLCIGYILPKLSVPSYVSGVISASVSVGMLVGGLVAGSLSDRIGRKRMLVASVGVNAVFGALASIAPSWQVLAVIRTIAGVGVGGSVPVVFTLATEYLPTFKRGFFITLIAWFWMVGSIYVAGLAWIVLGWQKASWRLFAIVCAIPAATASLLALFVLPESPRYLALCGDADGVERSLRCIAGMSRAPLPAGECEINSAPVAGESVIEPLEMPDQNDADGFIPESDKRETLVAERAALLDQDLLPAWDGATTPTMMAQCRDLFAPKLRRTSVLLLIAWFTLSLGWYGLILWIPTIFSKQHLDFGVYGSAFLVAAANLPGNIVSAFLMDRIGRRRVLFTTMFFSSILGALLGASKSSVLTVLFACALNAVAIGGWNALDCLSSESFPTSVRSTAMGTLAASGRIGSIVGQFMFGALVEHHAPAALFTGAALLFVGAIAGFCLPQETANHRLADRVDQL